jgi:hypothetical protein
MDDCRVMSKIVTAEDPNLASPGPAALRKINYGYNKKKAIKNLDMFNAIP